MGNPVSHACEKNAPPGSRTCFIFARRGCKESFQPPAYKKSLQPHRGNSFIATPKRFRRRRTPTWTYLGMRQARSLRALWGRCRRNPGTRQCGWAAHFRRAEQQGMVVLGTPLGCGYQLKCTKLGEAIPPHPHKSPGIAKASLDINWRAITECLKAIIACAECNHHHVV